MRSAIKASLAMPDHAHLLIPPQRGQGVFRQRAGRYDRNLCTPEEAQEKLAYMHDNPVRKGLVEVAADWPRSSCWAWDSGVGEHLPIEREGFPVPSCVQ